MRRGLARPPGFSVGWHDAVFEHYRVVDDDALQAWLPDGLVLDRHDGAAYVSVVSFRMNDMRWRCRWRLPLSHTYPQINVRVYVRSPDKVGVVFLRNLVSNRLAALAGRWLYGVPYVYQRVRLTLGDGGAIACTASLPGGLEHRVAGVRGARLTGHETDPTSLRYFLVERYPLFTRHRGATREAAMLHAPWHLYALDRVERTHAAIAALGIADAVEPVDAVHTSPGVDTMMWPAYRLGAMPPLVERAAPLALSGQR